MKTLKDVLAENVDEIIRTANAINKLIEDTKKAGVVWPELKPEELDRKDFELHRGINSLECHGCYFHDNGGCLVRDNSVFDCGDKIFIKKQQ